MPASRHDAYAVDEQHLQVSIKYMWHQNIRGRAISANALLLQRFLVF